MMVHLQEDMGTNYYAEDAFELMTVSPLNDSDELDDSPSDSETDRESTDSSGVTITNSSSYEDTDPTACNYDPQYTAFRTLLQREPSWTSSAAKDSYIDISSYEEQGPHECSFADLSVINSIQTLLFLIVIDIDNRQITKLREAQWCSG